MNWVPLVFHWSCNDSLQGPQLIATLHQSYNHTAIIEDIENQWKEKADARNKMIKKYFSSFEKGAGKRTAEMILDEYL